MTLSPVQKRRAGKPLSSAAKILPFGIVWVLLLTLGWWNGEQRAAALDSELREGLLRKTIQLTDTINYRWARKLAFDARDRESSEYALISEQLRAAAKTLSPRGIYTMKERSGKIFFGPESYQSDDPMASAPGDEYQKPSPVCFSVFQNKKAEAFGPVKDEFGIFVTALAPLIDSQNGEVVMVVGLDVLAEDWQARLNAARLGPIVRMIVIMFVLAGFGVAVAWRNKRVMIASMRLKSWVIFPVVLAVLGGCLGYAIYEYQQIQKMARRAMIGEIEQAREAWHRDLLAQAQLLEVQLNYVLENPEVEEAWGRRDRPALEGLTRPILSQLKGEYGISHYYFVESDRSCFLRVHQPERWGDRIDRFTLDMAERIGEDAWGLELGPLGAFTLRYVRALKKSGKITGYVELGIETEKMFQNLVRDTDLNAVIALRKGLTSREKFEAGKRIFGFSGRWDEYPDFVVIHRTAGAIFPEITLRSSGDVLRDGEVFSATETGRKILCGIMDLSDVQGRPAVRVFLSKDVTAEMAAGWAKLYSDLALLLVLLGGILALLWSVVDAAEIQLENAFCQIQEGAETYRRQFSDNLAIMLLIDPSSGRIVEANASALRFYGYERGQLIGKPIAEINILPVHEIEARIAEAVRKGGGKYEFRHRLADGSLRDVDVSASLIHFGGKRVLHSIIYDATARQKAERELSESQRATMNILEDLTDANEELKKFTQELTRAKGELELQSWGLQKANDGIKALYQEMEKKNEKLEKLDHLKDDFVSIVAHELRNPLGVVREAAALLLDGLVGPVAEQQKTYIEMVRRTAERLIHITSDLLDLAKIESGKIVLNFEKIDFLSPVRQACEGVKLRTRKKGVEVFEVFPGGPLEIEADFDKLSQVMINLLSNAVKFTEKGSITVEVKDLGQEVQCAVKDTGPGISPENVARLFSKFEQFGKPVAGGEKGSGLGLVISKSIIDAHGGRIWAESEFGKGTALFFELPKQQKKKKKLGEILIEEKTLTSEQLAEALRKQSSQRV